MNSKKDIHRLIENFIHEDRNTKPNPFLSTRVMASVEKKGVYEISRISSIWKTAVVAISLIAAVFTGIATGSLYQSNNNEMDVVLINDQQMENFGFYIQTGNE